MNDNICANCIHVEVCGWCDSVTQDACDFYECDGDWIKADVLQEIRQEMAESKYNHRGEYNRELVFNICLQIIDKKIKELSE